MNAEAECWCGWRKEYRNAFSAEFGLKAHWQYQCPLTKGFENDAGPRGEKREQRADDSHDSRLIRRVAPLPVGRCYA